MEPIYLFHPVNCEITITYDIVFVLVEHSCSAQVCIHALVSEMNLVNEVAVRDIV